MVILGFFHQTSQIRSGEAAKYRNIILPQNFHQLTPCSIFWGDLEGEGSATTAKKTGCWAWVRFGGNHFLFEH